MKSNRRRTQRSNCVWRVDHGNWCHSVVCKENKNGNVSWVFILFIRFKFNEHHSDLISRSNRLIGFSSRWLKELRSTVAMVSFYKTFMLPIIEYGSIIWERQTVALTNYIESIQQRFTRIVLHIPPNYMCYELRLKRLGLIKLSHRRIIAKIKFFKQIALGQAHCPDSDRLLPLNPSLRVTRHQHIYTTPVARPEYVENSPSISGMLLYNSLPTSLNRRITRKSLKLNYLLYFQTNTSAKCAYFFYNHNKF